MYDDYEEDTPTPKHNNSQGFHLEKSVSVGHLITTVSILFSMIWWGSTVETRLAVNEAKIAESVATHDRDQKDVDQLRNDIKEELKAINEKMDRLIEGKYNR